MIGKSFIVFMAASTLVFGAQFSPPRLADGHPDLQGVWQSTGNTGAFNLEEHPASYGTPAGRSIIVDPTDGRLPYLPGMREKANNNGNHRERDPVGAAIRTAPRDSCCLLFR